MMRIPFSLVLTLLILAGCAGSGATSGERMRNTMRATLGTSTYGHIIRVAEDVLLNRYGYQFERRIETTEDLRLETFWREMGASDDERALGYGYTRVRLTVRARPRDRNAGTYAASLNAEVEARGPTDDVWTKIPITAEREVYLKEVAGTIENEFKGGVRSGGPSG